VVVAACTSEAGGDDSTTPAGPRAGEETTSAPVGERTGDPAPPGSTAPAAERAEAPAAPADEAAKTGETAKPATPPARKVLDVTWQGQERYYWCGPASTRMALSTRLTTLPSQTTLANELPTSTNGTDYIGLVVNVLNNRLPGGNYTSREIADPPTAAQRTKLKADLVAIIADGYPIVANVVSGWRPPTWPAGTIYHYVTVIGYDANGDQAIIADPAAEGHGGSAAWNGVPRTYTISTYDLGTWIGLKGYTGR
jgi:hypothetical protein